MPYNVEMGREGRVEAVRPEVVAALRRGALVVTGNERAARTVRLGWDEERRRSGAERWEPAKAVSWRSWTAALWRQMLIEGRTGALLLNGFQEHAVWREVVAADEGAGSLRGVDALAEMAAETWGRMCGFAAGGERISRLLGDGGGGADRAAFARWARRFEERCQAEGLLSGAELEGVLTRAVLRRELRVGVAEVLLLGFDRLQPAQARLIEALRHGGVEVVEVASGVEVQRRVLCAAESEGEEVRSCARWAANWLRREPEARLAVIVPDGVGGAAGRAGMERVFREILAPELQWIGEQGEGPWEFSLGRRLAEERMVAVALELLRWMSGALPTDRVSGLLMSTYFAGGGEGEARAEFDAFELRWAVLLRPELRIGAVARMAAGSPRRAKRMPGLVGALRKLERRAAWVEGKVQSHGEWAEWMREALRDGGWETGGAASSEEFQMTERWEGVLDGVATLDFDGRGVGYAEALAAVERIARETVSAPQSRSAAVQVMGPMEAAGSEFDAVWFLQVGEMNWPPGAGSLPLAPWGLQRDLGMPGTDAGRDLEAARAVTERVLRSGSEVVVSYPRAVGEVRQRASGLVRAMGLEEVTTEQIAGSAGERSVVGMEWVEDRAELRALPDRVIGGGARVLQLQAACGFRAFAEQRLWSTELESRGLGFTPRESGTVVHRALESFWKEVETQGRLLAMSEEERGAAIGRAAEEGLRAVRVDGDGVWEEAYRRTQRDGLRRLMAGWLAVETERPAFEVRGSEEPLKDVEIGPLRLRLRVDRVDLVDGSEVLIDYKTGVAKTNEWLGDRPDSPQVPLYAVLAARGLVGVVRDEAGQGLLDFGWKDTPETELVELGAVAFAQVRPGKGAEMRGFASRANLLPGARLPKMDESTFEGQVERWGVVLEELARQFAAGESRVEPKSYPTTCKRCAQRVLCRLNPLLLEEVDEDDTEGDPADG